MPSVEDIDIFPAEHSYVSAMTHVFMDSFDRDGCVNLMYTKGEVWPVLQEILHDCIDADAIQLRLAVARDSRRLVGFISFSTIPAAGPVPDCAFNELTSWATQRMLAGSPNDHRYRLARELEDRSRHGQRLHLPSQRLIINTLVTYPDRRRRGVAAKLLACVTERARRDDWAVWAQTPAAFEGLFWRHGFRAVGAFGLDFNAFVPARDRARGRLGVQTWKQMKLGTRADVLMERRAAEARAFQGKKLNLVGADEGE